ncbi:MAG: 30S ribosomal protein S15 [Planctomycetaceae bacterium]|nr:30S ribosomal protein S15 [Planctomycetaceae bacterium]
MSITSETKTRVIQDYRRNEADTGSPEVQIAVLTQRIENLTEHMKGHQKDYAGRRGLLMLVSRRRRLLDYLKEHEPATYQSILGRLSIRK